MNLISSDGISTATSAVRTADASRNRLRLFVQFCTLRRRRFVFDLYSQLFTISSRVMDSFGGYTATVRTMRGPVFDPYLVFGRISELVPIISYLPDFVPCSGFYVVPVNHHACEIQPSRVSFRSEY